MNTSPLPAEFKQELAKVVAEKDKVVAEKAKVVAENVTLAALVVKLNSEIRNQVSRPAM
jgi:hypothetical protein